MNITRKAKGRLLQFDLFFLSTQANKYFFGHLHRFRSRPLFLSLFDILLDKIGMLIGNQRTISVHMVNRTFFNVQGMRFLRFVSKLSEKISRVCLGLLYFWINCCLVTIFGHFLWFRLLSYRLDQLKQMFIVVCLKVGKEIVRLRRSSNFFSYLFLLMIMNLLKIILFFVVHYLLLMILFIILLLPLLIRILNFRHHWLHLWVFFNRFNCLFRSCLRLLSHLIVINRTKRITGMLLFVLSGLVQMVRRGGKVTHQELAILSLLFNFVLLRFMVFVVVMRMGMLFLVRDLLWIFVFVGRRRRDFSLRHRRQLLFFFYLLDLFDWFLLFLLGNFSFFFLSRRRRRSCLLFLPLKFSFLLLIFLNFWNILLSVNFVCFLFQFYLFDLWLFLVLILFFHIFFLLNSLQRFSLIALGPL